MSTQLHSSPRQNARTWGNRFTSRWLEPGIVSYEDSGGDKELLKKETIDAFSHTFVGRPVIIRHSKVTPQTMQSKAQGYITRVWFEPADGWFHCEGIIFGDEAKDLIQRGWSVSCSYHVTNTDERGGVYHSIPYARELLAFDGEHLAIVENPRYEGATIRLNSKNKNTMNVFKMLRKLVAPKEAEPAMEPKTNDNSAPEDVSAESVVDLGNGKTATLGELVARYNESYAPQMETYARKDNESDEDYKNRCHALDEEKRKNEEEETKRKNEEEEAKKRKENSAADPLASQANATLEYIRNAVRENKDEEAKKRKENSAADPFATLANAANLPISVSTERANSAESMSDKIARGRERYGSTGHGNN